MAITRFLVQNFSALFFFAEWQPATSRNLSHTDHSVHVFPGKRQQVNNWSHGLCDWSLWVFLMQREAISYLMTAITFKQNKTKTHQTHFLLLLYFPGQSEYSKEGTFAISRLLCFHFLAKILHTQKKVYEMCDPRRLPPQTKPLPLKGVQLYKCILIRCPFLVYRTWNLSDSASQFRLNIIWQLIRLVTATPSPSSLSTLPRGN